MPSAGHITFGLSQSSHWTIWHYAGAMADLQGAIIGYGLAGAIFHAPLIASTPGLAVATVVTRDPGRREQALRDHPDARVVPSSEEVWERAAEHDFVVIAAPNDAHASLAERGLDAGLAVVVDKPLAPTAAEAASLVERAGASGEMLTVFQNRRWDSDQLTLRKLMREGVLGDVFRYESRFERWRPELRQEAWRESAAPAKGGGVLLDLGSHLVDQALQLYGPATHVYAEVESRRGAAGDDDAFLALRHRSGTSHLWMSAVSAAAGPRLRVLGTRGAYVVDGLDGQEDALSAGHRPDDSDTWGIEPESNWGRLVRGDESESVPSERGAWPTFYVGLERALREGGPPPVDPRDAIATLEVLEAARQSANEREVIALGS
jgi:scyllo-inositol 2-dehydrogenase (NADP+)